MSRRLPLLLACLALSTATFCAAPPADTSRMDQVARHYVDANQFMGTVLVARGEEIFFSKAYGSANLEWDIPNTVETKFRIGSVTKQFTAAAILLLEERGKLKLDDPIKTYYPGAPATWDAITLRQLLGHTSGIPNYTETPDFGRMSSWQATPEELVKRVQDQPLQFAPGAEMRYSNTGYVLLGMAIERASGTGYAAFLEQNIFDPLELEDTGYDENATIIPRRAAGYSPGPAGRMNAMHVNMSTPYSAGALYSTVGDLLRWERALFGYKLLSAASLEKMTLKGKGNYGLGISVDTEADRPTLKHGGGIPGFNSQLSYYPQSGIVVVTLSNLNGPGADQIARKLGALAHGEPVVLMSERKSITLPAKVLKKYVGRYDFAPDRPMTVTLENGQLHAQVTGDGKFPIAAETETRFFPLPFEAQFEFRKDEHGKVIGLFLGDGSGGGRLARRLGDAPAQ